MQNHPHRRSSGFTLLEAAIVLAIIGLIVGAVFVGTTLIRTGQVRYAIGQIGKIDTGIATFQAKYHQLPGDLSNAATIWPGAVNGDGDGQIKPVDLGGSVKTEEPMNMWNHLGLAQMIAGTYPAYTHQSDFLAVQTTAPAPQAKLTSGKRYLNLAYGKNIHSGKMGYFYQPSVYALDSTGDTDSLTRDDGCASGSACVSLLPSEAYQFDEKMDDGRPDAGRVQALDITSHYCSTIADGTVYDIQNKNFPDKEVCTILISSQTVSE